MLTEFWKSASGKLAERWAGAAAPALVFWVGGGLAWAFAGSEWTRVRQAGDWLTARDAASQLVVILIALSIVTASAIVVQHLTTPMLRLVEGYWPRRLDGLAYWLVGRAEQRRTRDHSAWEQLQTRIDDRPLTAQERAELARLEIRRRQRPILAAELMPTRVGNMLRAAETRPLHRYGLDGVAVWPRMWLVLPDTARSELTSARAAVDSSVAAMLWGAGFLGFTPWAWWALPAGLAVVFAAVQWWLPARVTVFADLIEASYDLYRGELYRQLRWPQPTNPAEELIRGRELTRYLVRGSDHTQPTFT